MPPIKHYSKSPSSLSLKDLISRYSDHLTDSDICLLNSPPYALTIPLEILLPNSKHRTTHLPPRPQNPWILFRRDFEAKYRKDAPAISARIISSLASETWRKDDRNIVKRFFRTLAKVTVIIHQLMYPEYKFSPKKAGKEKKWTFKPDARSLQFEETKRESAINTNGEEKVGEEEETMVESDKVNIPLENKYSDVTYPESHPEAKEINAEAAFPAVSTAVPFLTTRQTFLPTPALDLFTVYSPVTQLSNQVPFNDGRVVYLASPDSEICTSDLMKNACPIDDSNERGWNCDVRYGSPSLLLPSMPLQSSYGMDHFDFPLYHHHPEAACVIDSSSYPYLSDASSGGFVYCGTSNTTTTPAAAAAAAAATTTTAATAHNIINIINTNGNNPQSQIQRLLSKQMDFHLDCSKQRQ